MDKKKVAVIGLGKLGLPVACCFANAGHYVYGIDKNKELLQAINDRIDPHDEPYLKGAMELALDTTLVVTDNIMKAVECEFIIIIVPTPSEPTGAFSNDYVLRVLTEIGPYLRSDQIVVVSSTVMPQSCERVFAPLLETNSVSLLYSPEFIALGNVIYDFKNPDMVLIGGKEKPAFKYEQLIKTVVASKTPIYKMTWTEAEVTKLSVNTYLDLKIAFVNVLASLALEKGADPQVVAKAVGTDTRIGNKYFRPGLPPGGTCLPRDLDAFIHALGHSTMSDLPDAIKTVNSTTFQGTYHFIEQHLKPEDTVGILGLAYKVGTPVTEQSFGYTLASQYVRFRAPGTVYVFDRKAQGPPGSVQMSVASDLIDKVDVVIICGQDTEFASIDLRGKTTIDIWGVRENSPSIFSPLRPLIGE